MFAEVKRNPIEDSILVARMAGGDQAALRSFYERHAGRLMAIALRILRERGEAEDLIQEIFLEVWRRAGEFDPKRGQASAWVSTMCRTRAIDRLRARASSARAAVDASREPAHNTASPAIDLVSRRREGAEVARALASLPAAQRQVIELVYFEGLSHSQIALRTGEPLGTIKARVRLGLLKLAAHLRWLRQDSQEPRENAQDNLRRESWPSRGTMRACYALASGLPSSW